MNNLIEDREKKDLTESSSKDMHMTKKAYEKKLHTIWH